MTPPEISAAFPFEPHFVAVHGSQLHYVDEGEGDPIVFLQEDNPHLIGTELARWLGTV